MNHPYNSGVYILSQKEIKNKEKELINILKLLDDYLHSMKDEIKVSFEIPLTKFVGKEFIISSISKETDKILTKFVDKNINKLLKDVKANLQRGNTMVSYYIELTRSRTNKDINFNITNEDKIYTDGVRIVIGKKMVKYLLLSTILLAKEVYYTSERNRVKMIYELLISLITFIIFHEFAHILYDHIHYIILAEKQFTKIFDRRKAQQIANIVADLYINTELARISTSEFKFADRVGLQSKEIEELKCLPFVDGIYISTFFNALVKTFGTMNILLAYAETEKEKKVVKTIIQYMSIKNMFEESVKIKLLQLPNELKESNIFSLCLERFKKDLFKRLRIVDINNPFISVNGKIVENIRSNQEVYCVLTNQNGEDIVIKKDNLYTTYDKDIISSDNFILFVEYFSKKYGISPQFEFKRAFIETFKLYNEIIEKAQKVAKQMNLPMSSQGDQSNQPNQNNQSNSNNSQQSGNSKQTQPGRQHQGQSNLTREGKNNQSQQQGQQQGNQNGGLTKEQIDKIIEDLKKKARSGQLVDKIIKQMKDALEKGDFDKMEDIARVMENANGNTTTDNPIKDELAKRMKEVFDELSPQDKEKLKRAYEEFKKRIAEGRIGKYQNLNDVVPRKDVADLKKIRDLAQKLVEKAEEISKMRGSLGDNMETSIDVGKKGNNSILKERRKEGEERQRGFGSGLSDWERFLVYKFLHPPRSLVSKLKQILKNEIATYIRIRSSLHPYNIKRSFTIHEYLNTPYVIYPKRVEIPTSSICFVIDTSGSMSVKDIERFFSWVLPVVKTFNLRNIRVILFASGTYFDDVFKTPKDIEDYLKHKLVIKSGGTDLAEPLERLVRDKKFYNTPIVIYTDGYCGRPEKQIKALIKKGCSQLYVITDDETPTNHGLKEVFLVRKFNGIERKYIKKYLQ